MKYLKWAFITTLFLIPFCAKAEHARYAGMDFKTSFHNDNGISTKIAPSFNFFSGIKLHEKLTFEAGAYHSTKLSTSRTSLTKRAVYGTVLADIPVCFNLSFKFGAGATQYMPITQDKGKLKKLHYRIIPRFCTGFGFMVTDSVEGRIGLVWEGSSMLDKLHPTFINDNLHLNFGLAYSL